MTSLTPKDQGLSFRLRSFRSSGFGRELIPELYDLIEDLLISQLEEERAEYKRDIATLKYMKNLANNLDATDLSDYFSILSIPESEIERIGLIRALNNMKTYDDSSSSLQLLMQCYKDNHLIAIEEMKKSHYSKMSLEYAMEIIDDGEVCLSEEEDKEFIRIYEELFGVE